MGLRWAEKYPEVKRVFDCADDILQKSISKIAFSGPESELIKTENSQLAIFVLDCAYWSLYKDLLPAATAGHSLGEFAALVASGALSFVDTLKLVRVRAEMMAECAQAFPGAMIAVIGGDLQLVQETIQTLKKEGTAAIANYNCPDQVVVSCERHLCKTLKEKLQRQGAKRLVELPVSGGFHSPLVAAAASRFRTQLKGVKFSDAIITLVSNTSGEGSKNGKVIKHNLEQQMDSPVRWEESVRWMVNRDIKNFLELGPGKVLKGLVKRIAPEVNVRSIEDSSFTEIRDWLTAIVG